jgi:hypothetical protein
MYLKQHLVTNLNQNLQFTKNTLSDFSDADLFVRPCPGANHAAWQLGHLIRAETNLTEMVAPGKGYKLPADFEGLFVKETAKTDDPAKFGKYAKKDELLALFEKVRGATVAWVNGLSTADFDQPTPEKIRGFASTLADMAAMHPLHTNMHLGQWQVIRRKLGKPVLF